MIDRSRAFEAPLRATYVIRADGGRSIEARARALCVEQTIEFPPDLVTREDILEGIVARVEQIEQLGGDRARVEVAFPDVVVGRGDLPQLLNVLFGNISLQPGLRLVDVELPEGVLEPFRGPRFGRAGLRRLLGVEGRPLLATALKPMGLSPSELADLARSVVEGGVDIVKDDHGLADQDFAPFEERVARCAAVIEDAAIRRGRPCLYFVNVTAPVDRIVHRARSARAHGAGGLVVAPGLVGHDTMRLLAEDDRVGLPVASHPSFQGAFTTSSHEGVAHGVLHGLLNRLAGADVTIFPSFGGRFSFTEEECRDLVRGAEAPLGRLAPIFPAPAGGMTLDRLDRLIEFYGRDVVLLVGGDMHRHGATPGDGCRRLLELVERRCS